MNNPFSSVDWKKVSPMRLVLVIIVVLVGLAIILTILGTLFGSLTGVSQSTSFDSMGGANYRQPVTAGKSFNGIAMEDMAYESSVSSSVLSGQGGSIGGDAEEYETLSYDALIKTGELEQTCDAVETWKPLAYVVFEQAQRSDTSCYYTFKVERTHMQTIVAAIEALDPDELNASTETIKQQLVERESQLDILLRRQAQIKNTLEDAIRAYDQLVVLATDAENVETLSKVIDSKLQKIELLGDRRIMLAAQIDSMARTISRLTDRIDYAHFTVRVYKYEVVDFGAVKDSWVAEMRAFTHGINDMLQRLTLGLLTNLMALAYIVVYLAILLAVLLFVAKHGWRAVRRFWQS